MEATTRNPGAARRLGARLLAVLAIAGAAVALFVVISGSLDSSSDDGREKQPAKSQQQGQNADTYVVQPGDTLGGIASKTGVPVDQLQNLNPDVDPQALPSGASLKLH
jgi:LysM repeat protein